jgi:hypothetical protein
LVGCAGGEGFVCGNQVLKDLIGCFLGKLCVNILVEEFPLPVSKTLVVEHVQGSDLALDVLDPCWCLGGLIFAIASFITCNPFLITVLPYLELVFKETKVLIQW